MRSLSYANVTATIALVLAAGGGAVAIGAGGGGVVGGHVKAIPDDGSVPVTALEGTLNVRAECNLGSINPILTNTFSRQLEVVRVANGNSTSEIVLAPGGPPASFGIGAGLRYTEFQAFPAGGASSAVATLLVTTDTESDCADSQIAVEGVIAD